MSSEREIWTRPVFTMCTYGFTRFHASHSDTRDDAPRARRAHPHVRAAVGAETREVSQFTYLLYGFTVY